MNGESCGVLEHCDSALTNAAADCFAAATSKGYIRFCLESRKKKLGGGSCLFLRFFGVGHHHPRMVKNEIIACNGTYLNDIPVQHMHLS